MGSWGIKALESDTGCDIIYEIGIKYREKTIIELTDIISDTEYFPKNMEVDYYYDMEVLTITELYLNFKETGYTDLEGLKHIKSIVANKKDIQFLLQMLYDIRDEKPDKDGERELVELWKESKLWKEWKAHLLDLIYKMEKELTL